jgi:hypothetical protein
VTLDLQTHQGPPGNAACGPPSKGAPGAQRLAGHPRKVVAVAVMDLPKGVMLSRLFVMKRGSVCCCRRHGGGHNTRGLAASPGRPTRPQGFGGAPRAWWRKSHFGQDGPARVDQLAQLIVATIASGQAVASTVAEPGGVGPIVRGYGHTATASGLLVRGSREAACLKP